MSDFNLIVIGAGPGGYVAAIRAAQLGMKVLCVDQTRLGGTCLSVGCIPSKALLESSGLYAKARGEFSSHGILVSGLSLDLSAMMARKQKIVDRLRMGIAGLFKKNGVAFINASARLLADQTVEMKTGEGVQVASSDFVLIATGSRPIELPILPFNGKTVIDSTQALSFDRVPDSLAVIGAGAIGLELGSVFSRLGSRVEVIEVLDRIAPSADLESSSLLRRSLKKQGMGFRLSTRLTGAEVRAGDLALTLEDQKSGSSKIDVACALVSVGRRPYTEGLGLEELGIERDERGHVIVNDCFETSCAGVFAIGDVIKGPMLAHRASEEGVAFAEYICEGGKKPHLSAIPSVIYTSPELASVGLTEEEVKERVISHRVSKFPFAASGRALAMSESEGMVKLIAHAETGKLLGAHIVGPHASELIAQAAVAMKAGLTAQDLAETIYAHPTLSETLKEAAMGIFGKPIHV